MAAAKLVVGALLAATGDTYTGSSVGARSVEQPMSQLPSIKGAYIDVQMLGQNVDGVHVTGHLVKMANPAGRVSLAMPPLGCGTREKTTVTSMAHRPACRLAINAGYFNVHDGSCIGNVVSHGSVIQSVPLSQGNVNFGVKDGRFVVGYLTPEELQGFDFVVSGVVWLVRDGKNYVQQGWAEANTTVQTSGDKYATKKASRTAVGYDHDGKLIIVQIDGSIAVGVGRGMDMTELADALIKHGALNAINLDGGGSSAMARDGVLVNYPSDSRPPSCDASGLYQCERPVSTVLCLHEEAAEEVLESQGAGGGAGGAGGGAGGAVLPFLGGALVFALGGVCAFFARSMFERRVVKKRSMASRDLARQVSESSATGSVA